MVLLVLVIFSSSANAQKTILKGIVKDKGGNYLTDVLVLEHNTNNYTVTDKAGNYQLSIRSGENRISFSFVGFKKEEVKINTPANSKKQLNITLQFDTSFALDDIVILGKSNVRKVKESGFNAVAVDATPFHNVSVDLSQVLDRVSGVKILQEGGLGSRANATINGLSGRHVRFFIDGMPMDAMSSAFQINNLPINLAERVEVYKGVVPVNFGSDALGGAVNIVTKKIPGKYLDASYSFGSFNTHMTFVNAGYTSKKGFTTQLSAYQNYSDNSYYVNAKVLNFETSLLSKQKQRVKRFNDAYHNEVAIAKIGFVDKTFADQLLFGITLAKEYDEIQHPAYINIAFGEKYQTSYTVMPSFLYSKKSLFAKNLDVSLAANYNFGGGNNYDLSDKEYNWLGKYRKSPDLGEIQYSDFEYKKRNGTINANINYDFNDNYRLTINNVANFFSRKGDEKKRDDDYINLKPQTNNKNILGIGLKGDVTSNFSFSIFSKYYTYKASAFLNLSQQNGVENFKIVSKNDEKLGYGLTATYFLTDNLQAKANYEQTARLPVSWELFGEVFGFYLANFNLKPETSNNINVGFNYNLSTESDNAFSIDANFFYRQTKDYIRRNINFSQGEASFVNIHQVRIPGIDAELRYSYKNKFTLGGNVSYLKPRNYDTSSTYYKAILPNTPTFFANADATYFIENIWLSESKLSLNYNLRFVDDFFYEYTTYKAKNGLFVPTQWSHDLGTTYSWKKGKYNLSLGVKNIFDADLFDNYSLQKPGRSFSIKLRYYINKS